MAAPQTGLTSCQIGGIGYPRTVHGNPRHTLNEIVKLDTKRYVVFGNTCLHNFSGTTTCTCGVTPTQVGVGVLMSANYVCKTICVMQEQQLHRD